MSKEVQLIVDESTRPSENHYGHIDSDLKMITFADVKTMDVRSERDSSIFWCFGQKWKARIRLSPNRKFGFFLVHCPSSDSYKGMGLFNFVVNHGCRKKVIYSGYFYAGHNRKNDCFGGNGSFDFNDSEDHICVSLEMVLHHDNQFTNLRGQDYKLRQSMHNALSDSATSDISFDVKGRVFHAHLVILKAMAPEFVQTLNLEEHDASSPVPISDVEPETFQTMIDFIYGGTITCPEESEIEYAKATIEASDKYLWR